MLFNRRRLLLSGSLLGLGTMLGLTRAAAGAEGDFPFMLSDDEWQTRLSPEAYQVLRHEGTERAFTSPLNDEKRNGTFRCAGCDQALFASDKKYDSGTGWPSFWDVLPKAIVERTDYKIGVPRTEVLCITCGGHLGHVFDDGPKPTGLRYCMNGLALKFLPEVT